ncbi:GNAT family N-acetyltransferase [Paenibacillus sp. FSL F4-0243]|uniref:GNAT family N-acetyltransferase n=1 Tax=Paenibacillus sp. FSL F4-0243 TaxID=2954732 RepID=UPI0030DD5EE8
MYLVKEENPIWDNEKENIVGNVEVGTFNLENVVVGEELCQEWFKLIDDNVGVLGFGWIDYNNNNFEISVAVHKDYQGSGSGSIIIEELERIAKEKGFNEVRGIVKSSNPNAVKMIEWLYRKNYKAYWMGLQRMEPKSQEFAINAVRKLDIELIKELT